MTPLLFFVLGLAVLLLLFLAVLLNFKASADYKNYVALEKEYENMLLYRQGLTLILCEIAKKDPEIKKVNSLYGECLEDWEIEYNVWIEPTLFLPRSMGANIQLDEDIRDIYPKLETSNIDALEILTKLKESDNSVVQLHADWKASIEKYKQSYRHLPRFILNFFILERYK